MVKLIMLTLAAVVFATFLFGMRTKSPRVLGTVRKVNRRCVNPTQMKTAGTPGAYAAILRHTGRKTGTPYETPIGAVPTADGFVVALPYGMQADWLQNVLAAGSATIVHEGIVHPVDQPAVVPMAEAASLFPPDQTRALRLFKVEHCLLLRNAEVAEVPTRVVAGT